MSLSKDQVTESLRLFVSRRDALLHEDEATFEHHLQRFVDFCQTDALVQSVLSPLQSTGSASADAWWQALKPFDDRLTSHLNFPANLDEEVALRFEIIKSVVANPHLVSRFGIAFGKQKQDEWIELFRTLVVRPFAEELTERLSKASNLATPEERALQAVPLDRIPRTDETRIFLSHRSVDKPLVHRYYNALKTAGFSPWLDESEMPAGTNLERGIYKGFEESCTAVFFITENFKDERYLATEVDYAVMQKRKKGAKFAIITLRYSNAAEVPGLLTPYVYKTVSNDLEGFYELLRALPIELGPVRWKVEVVKS
jgi:hypothetical protein